MSEYMSFLQALQISLVSMLIVFILLYAISLVLSCFKFMPKEKVIKTQNTSVKNSENKIQKQSQITSEELENNIDMLLVTMVASMEANGENKKNNFKIVSIKEI